MSRSCCACDPCMCHLKPGRASTPPDDVYSKPSSVNYPENRWEREARQVYETLVAKMLTPELALRDVGTIASALQAAHDAGLERAAAKAGDTSDLTTQLGNRFDEGYSQGRYDAMLAIRALKDSS